MQVGAAGLFSIWPLFQVQWAIRKRRTFDWGRRVLNCRAHRLNELLLRNDSGVCRGPLAVDAQQFAPAISDADDPQLGIIRLRHQRCQKRAAMPSLNGLADTGSNGFTAPHTHLGYYGRALNDHNVLRARQRRLQFGRAQHAWWQADQRLAESPPRYGVICERLSTAVVTTTRTPSRAPAGLKRMH